MLLFCFPAFFLLSAFLLLCFFPFFFGFSAFLLTYLFSVFVASLLFCFYASLFLLLCSSLFYFSCFPNAQRRVLLWGSGPSWLSLDAAFLRPQPSSAVRNRWQPFASVPVAGSASGHFWRFQTSRSLVSRGRRGISCNSNMFHNMSKAIRKSFCGAGAVLLSRFQKMIELHVSWQAQHFGDPHHHFSWQAQHFRRVVSRVCCESHC